MCCDDDMKNIHIPREEVVPVLCLYIKTQLQHNWALQSTEYWGEGRSDYGNTWVALWP
jgi:hypothetical protein